MSGSYAHSDRVIKALNHEESDRVPRDMGGRVSSMMDGAYYTLKDYLSLDDCRYDTINQDWFSVEEFDERVLEEFDIDFRRVYLKASSEYKKQVKKDGSWIDELGFTRRHTGEYGEPVDHLFRYAQKPEDIINYQFYDAYDPARVDEFTRAG